MVIIIKPFGQSVRTALFVVESEPRMTLSDGVTQFPPSREG